MPDSARIYLRLRNWLDGIQSELDMSWAVLGELYGRFTPLDQLGMRWRRVRSNLDDIRSLEASVRYLPRRVRFDVARSELLSLLIRPLYGDDPSYGVRELMQNAVDAVHEREYYQQKYPDTEVKLREQESQIVVSLSEWDAGCGEAWFEIVDQGIGMTEEMLVEYFLTAGASYRRSDKWQSIFEDESQPLMGDSNATLGNAKSHVVRSGRFGVGALAAFLLGDIIEVETRHVSSDVGFRFSAYLSQEVINIEKTFTMPTGTR
ncbi:MAG: ATP-binding protein, partial [Planctomycetaceae bacterium]|nr:ATP-binding protein [Planctomycetaceae bacterium]